MAAPRSPLVVFDFDDTLFPTTALREFSKRELAADPEFTLPKRAAGLLAAWDALALYVMERVVAAAGPRAAPVAIVSAGDPEWVGQAMRAYMPRLHARVLEWHVDVRAGVGAQHKSRAIEDVVKACTGPGRLPDALVVVGDSAFDAKAAREAAWEGLGARAFVQIEPQDRDARVHPMRAVECLAQDLARVPECVRDALRR